MRASTFALTTKERFYNVGRTSNLNQRWLSHHRLSDVERAGCTKLAYLSVEYPNLLLKIEAALIDWFCLLLNGRKKASEEQMIRISATIPESVIEQFKELCKKERRSVSAQLTLLMEKALKKQKEEVAA